MKDRTGKTANTKTVRGNQSSSLPIRRPGRLIVEFIGGLGPDTRHLDVVASGEMVTATGTITGVNLVGHDEYPRAIVTVTGADGESAQCTVDTEHYLDLWGYLVEDTRVQVRGTVRRPLLEMPALIDVKAIRPALSVVAAQARAVSA
ncbi:hypothetical protein [Streptomyces javensis]|uniref:Uncharacterized protein n=1 Tax=Streptomyces javensis TaxID=114698 RepID=A0ABS0R5T2_9ACTN|nr:hypothetical protein [Streptomyces javensis]MBI0312724.1 hypothetical protein [Streptomyces javensis]